LRWSSSPFPIADCATGDNFRLVQFTPPGSGSSIQFGVNLTSAAPGSKRLAGRVAGNTTYASAHDLAEAMTRAAKAPEQHEKRTGQSDANWPDWYAEYMVREQLGE
jgi:hypothetical protein